MAILCSSPCTHYVSPAISFNSSSTVIARTLFSMYSRGSFHTAAQRCPLTCWEHRQQRQSSLGSDNLCSCNIVLDATLHIQNRDQVSSCYGKKRLRYWAAPGKQLQAVLTLPFIHHPSVLTTSLWDSPLLILRDEPICVLIR